MYRKAGTYKEESKLESELFKYKRKCNCGHTVTMLPIHKKDYVICNWCHMKVFRDADKQKMQDEKVKRESFRIKIWNLINGGY